MPRCLRSWLLARKATLFVTIIALAAAAYPQEYRGSRTSEREPATLSRISTASRRGSDVGERLPVARTAAAISPPALEYYGGPVVSNPEIVVVFWGNNVDPSTVSGIGGFYQAVLGSSFMDLLGEYDTLGQSPGTNQAIGHGTVKGTYTITPSQGRNATSTQLYDDNIEVELLDQITGGALPGPSFDAAGIQNTIYMIYFPPGITITAANGGVSCVNFYAYHGLTTYTYNTRHLRYGVFPDNGPTSACSNVGGAGSAFDNLTAFSSHELAEAVTDPVAGYYSSPGVTGWYDTSDGEIADICNLNETSGPSGYTVQRLWSNLQQQCANSPAQLVLTAQTSVPMGVPFNLTVAAQDSSGRTLGNYTGVTAFSSTDGEASLPPNFSFSSSAAGSANFSVTLRTLGAQAISVNDTRALTVKGAATVNVVQGINVSVGTTPAGPSYSVDGVVYNTPHVLTWAPGTPHTLAVDSPQTGAPGDQFLFRGWSDTGAATHTVIAPNSAATFTAYFDSVVNPQRPIRPVRSTPMSSPVVTRSRHVIRRDLRRARQK